MFDGGCFRLCPFGKQGEHYVAPHPSIFKQDSIPTRLKDNIPFDVKMVLANPVYTKAYLESVAPRHVPPKSVSSTLVVVAGAFT
jgi:hypothetical protein